MIWKNIIKTALIGTDRSDLSEATLVELAKLGVDMEATAANILLEGATLFAQMRKAGFQPEKWKGEIPTPAQKDKSKICSKKSSEHLSMILNGTFPLALDSFIQQLVFNKKTFPPELLPELLEKSRSDKTLWHKLKNAIGERGNWLIVQNEDWHFLIDKSDHVAWEDGTKSERLLLLNSLRKTQPNEALENIESSWGEDDWKHRVEYLKILEYNLSLADEPFLEKCLDEKRKDLRRTAAGLLEKIEGSKLQKRMRERLRDCINLKSRSFKKEKTEIEIELPESCDHGMLRDGIDPKKKWLKGGLKASYFAQMFIVLPPSDWERFFEKKTNEVLDIFIRSEWSELLLQASIVSAVRHQDENWMKEICHIYFNKYDDNRWENLDVNLLLEKLPENIFNQFAIQELKDFNSTLENSEPLAHLLQFNLNSWDKNLTLLLMKNLRHLISQNIDYGWNMIHYSNILNRAAYGIDPKLFEVLNKSWTNDESYWTNWGKEIDKFLRVLKFRRDMQMELEK